MQYVRRKLELIGWGIVIPNREGEEFPSRTDGFGDGYDHRQYWDGGRFLGPDPWGVVPIYEDRKGRRFPAEAEMVRCFTCGGPCMAVPDGRGGYRHRPL